MRGSPYPTAPLDGIRATGFCACDIDPQRTLTLGDTAAVAVIGRSGGAAPRFGLARVRGGVG